jgi:hypothetical protein
VIRPVFRSSHEPCSQADYSGRTLNRTSTSRLVQYHLFDPESIPFHTGDDAVADVVDPELRQDDDDEPDAFVNRRRSIGGGGATPRSSALLCSTLGTIFPRLEAGPRKEQPGARPPVQRLIPSHPLRMLSGILALSLLISGGCRDSPLSPSQDAADFFDPHPDPTPSLAGVLRPTCKRPCMQRYLQRGASGQET